MKYFIQIFYFTSSDKEPDEKIYLVLVSIPVLFFLIGLFFLCRNLGGLLNAYCTMCCAQSTRKEKEDLNPTYGTDLDEVTSVAEVAWIIVQGGFLTGPP